MRLGALEIDEHMCICRGFDVSYSKIILFPMVLLTCIGSNAHTKVDVAFKGKTDLYYTDVCANKGTIYEGVFYRGLYTCSLKFNEYGGLPLIKNNGEICDSEVFYEPASGKLINLKLSYDEYHFDNLIAIISERYGKGVYNSEKNSIDPKLGVKYEWSDAKGGRILLGVHSETKIPEGRLLPVVVRYCAFLTIKTKEMNNSFDLWWKGKDEQYKNKVKSNASKL